jgi:hypothetical protein
LLLVQRSELLCLREDSRLPKISARFIRCKNESDVLVVSRRAYDAIRNGGFTVGCGHPHLVILGPAKFKAAERQKEATR